MSKLKKIVLFLIVTLLISGCTPTTDMAPVKNNGNGTGKEQPADTIGTDGKTGTDTYHKSTNSADAIESARIFKTDVAGEKTGPGTDLTWAGLRKLKTALDEKPETSDTEPAGEYSYVIECYDKNGDIALIIYTDHDWNIYLSDTGKVAQRGFCKLVRQLIEDRTPTRGQ